MPFGRDSAPEDKNPGHASDNLALLFDGRLLQRIKKRRSNF
jgi:hypothetical protein